MKNAVVISPLLRFGAHFGILAGITAMLFFGGNAVELLLGNNDLESLRVTYRIPMAAALIVLGWNTLTGAIIIYGCFSILRGKNIVLASTGFFLSSPLWIFALYQHLDEAKPLGQAGELIAITMLCLGMPILFGLASGGD